MSRLGVKIKNICTDRGSEYFEQEGDSKLNSGRQLHEFSLYCVAQQIVHTLQPVEMQEKIAEGWFRDHFTAVDAMLYGMQDYLQHFGLTLWYILSIALIALRVIILVVLYRLGSFSLGSVRAGISSACLVVMSLSIFRIMPLQKCQVSLRGGS